MAPTPQSVKADATVCADLALTIKQSYLPGKAEKMPTVAVTEPLTATALGPCFPAQIVNNAQPTPTPGPELKLKAKDNTGVPLRRSIDMYGRFKALLHELWIGVIYVFPRAVMRGLGAIISITIPLAIPAVIGAIVMLTGNGVLREAYLAHYTDNRSAAAIGSLGAIVSGLVLFFPFRLFDVDLDNPPLLFKIILSVVQHTLSGALGSSILLIFQLDLGPIDVLHATRAGAVGGAILGGLVWTLELVYQNDIADT